MAIRCGFVLPGGTAPQQLEMAELAEAAGWDGVFVWEAAFGVDAWALLAAIAVRTNRIEMGTMLTPLPWRRPWKVAGQLITVDQLSGGRAVLAVGLGAVAPELGETGEPQGRAERAALLDEGLGIVLGLLDGRMNHVGARHRVDLDRPEFFGNASVVRRPRPPVWIVGAWPHQRSMNRVLRGDGLLPNVMGDDGARPATLDEVPAIRDWLDDHTTGRRLDLIVDGETPDDDTQMAADTVGRWRDAGATWWLETRWGPDQHRAEHLERARRRIAAGPPRPG